MKICLLAPRFPFPQFGGDVLRLNEISKYLKSKGHELILVSLSDVKCQVCFMIRYMSNIVIL